MSGADAKHEGDNNLTMCCAGCGIAGVDDVKLKDCDLVQCCDECQREHRPNHEKECKRRAAELRDEILFKQPEISHYGDCPICCLPLSLDIHKSSLYSCCCKWICKGCNYANMKREMNRNLEHKCPFCRYPPPKTKEEYESNLMKRVEAKDPFAMGQMGFQRANAGDLNGAVEYFSKAAALGDIISHYNLSVMYHDGECVEKDEKKQVYHLEEAAIGGDPNARYNLGCVEKRRGRMDRAVKHWIIAAKLGDNHSLDKLKYWYRKGLVSKKDLATALRAHQAAVDATKSSQRDEAVRLETGRPTCVFG